MSIQELGALGEFVGSIAVLATLVYLAIQTRHTRAANEASIQWQRANASREMSMMWATNPDAVELLGEFGQPESEVPDFGGEFNPRAFRYLAINQTILLTHQANLLTSLTQTDREMVIAQISQNIRMPGFRRTWPTLKARPAFHPEFIAIVENALEDKENP